MHSIFLKFVHYLPLYVLDKGGNNPQNVIGRRISIKGNSIKTTCIFYSRDSHDLFYEFYLDAKTVKTDEIEKFFEKIIKELPNYKDTTCKIKRRLEGEAAVMGFKYKTNFILILENKINVNVRNINIKFNFEFCT